ncbi:MAG: hypothetical protein DMD89_17775 [Candidatus Rokuibacteriota bacterium]|nr:MAG: hypothetical protein DMD89_17775 [Candidatus Rokubacteria bacterium]
MLALTMLACPAYRTHHVQEENRMRDYDPKDVAGRIFRESSKPSIGPHVAMGHNTEIDPVCKKAVPRGAAKAEHDGQTYYFCGTECKDKFGTEPKKYIE